MYSDKVFLARQSLVKSAAWELTQDTQFLNHMRHSLLRREYCSTVSSAGREQNPPVTPPLCVPSRKNRFFQVDQSFGRNRTRPTDPERGPR